MNAKIHSLKITKAGYVYIDAVKVSPLKLSPLSVGELAKEAGAQHDNALRAWCAKNYTMV